MPSNRSDRFVVNRKEAARHGIDLIISELEYMAGVVSLAEDGKRAARLIHQRINKLLEEKAKCRLN